MTNKKAKEILQEIIIADKTDKEFKDAIKSACEALEKQIPVKPIPVKSNNFCKCPVCKFMVSTYYCYSCGQKIDWSK